MTAISLNEDIAFENVERHFHLKPEDGKLLELAKRIFTLKERASDGIDPIETRLYSIRGIVIANSNNGASLHWSTENPFSSEFEYRDATGAVSAKFKLLDERSVEMYSLKGEVLGTLSLSEDFKRALFTDPAGESHAKFFWDEDASEWSISWDGKGALDPSLIDVLAIITDVVGTAHPSPTYMAMLTKLFWRFVCVAAVPFLVLAFL